MPAKFKEGCRIEAAGDASRPRSEASSTHRHPSFHGTTRSAMLAPTKTKVEPGKLFINGRFVAAAAGATFDTINPATGEVLTQVAEGHEEDIDRAVMAARAAFDTGPWTRTMTATDRARILW